MSWNGLFLTQITRRELIAGAAGAEALRSEMRRGRIW
jgi:hypothetical protein